MDAGWSGMENTRDYQWDAIRTGSGGSGINGEYTELDVRGHLSEIVDNWEDLKKGEQDALVRSFQFLAENDPVGYGELVKDLKSGDKKVKVEFKPGKEISNEDPGSKGLFELGLCKNAENIIYLSTELKGLSPERLTFWIFPQTRTEIFTWQAIIHEFIHRAQFNNDPDMYANTPYEIRETNNYAAMNMMINNINYNKEQRLRNRWGILTPIIRIFTTRFESIKVRK